MSEFYADEMAALLVGDCREQMRTLPAGFARTCITSPPYWGLRDYGVDGQIGLEQGPDEYVTQLVEVFRDVRRCLTDDGTLWLNLGDSYAMSTKGSSGKGAKQVTNVGTQLPNRHWRVPDGCKAKDLVGIPWLVAFALRDDGWYLRQDIIWHKLNPMPESVKDRCTKAHEYLFLLSKSADYCFDHEAIDEPSKEAGRTVKLTAKSFALGQALGAGVRPSGNGLVDSYLVPSRRRRDVWSVASAPYKGAHFATMPPALVEPCILAGSVPGDIVLDPFSGAGTTGLVARKLGRRFVGTELNPEYAKLTVERWQQTG